jgi:hypothetical protein
MHGLTHALTRAGTTATTATATTTAARLPIPTPGTTATITTADMDTDQVTRDATTRGLRGRATTDLSTMMGMLLLLPRRGTESARRRLRWGMPRLLRR